MRWFCIFVVQVVVQVDLVAPQKTTTCTTKNMATVNLFLIPRPTVEDEGIIKIVITHNRVKRLYTTGLKVTLDQWQHLPKKGEKLDNRVKDETRLKLYADIYATPNGFTDVPKPSPKL